MNNLKIKFKNILMITNQRQSMMMQSYLILMWSLQTSKGILVNIWITSKLLIKLRKKIIRHIKVMKNSKLKKGQDVRAWRLSTNMPLSRKNLLRPYSHLIYLQTFKTILSLKKMSFRNLTVCIFFITKNIFLENQQRIKVYSRKMNNIENAIKNCEINYRFEND